MDAGERKGMWSDALTDQLIMSEPIESPREYQLIGPSDDGRLSDLLADRDAKSSRRRLQALIAEWLRMENLVVVTGAGTSVSSGGKTMNTLERSVLETVCALPDLPEGIRRVVDSRLEQASSGEQATALAFEDWLSYLVNAQYIGSAPNSPFLAVHWKDGLKPTQSELSWFVSKVASAIFAECALTLPDTRGTATTATDIAPHLAFLAKLVARDSNLGRAHLFTLNYDTLFEQALELLGIQYSDGFTGRADARFDPAVYGLDIYYPGEVSEGRVRRFDKFLHLYKLHGSIHWQLRDGELRARHPDLSQFEVYRDLTPADKATTLAAASPALSAAGILPTANKFTQTLTMPFSHLFRALQIRLSVPQTFLLVLGYGFGDEHVTRILETALMNPSLVLLVVEPNPSSTTVARIQRYKDLGKRAFVLTPTAAAHEARPFTLATFDDFSRSIMPDVQWLDDFLRLRRFESQVASSAHPSESPTHGRASDK